MFIIYGQKEPKITTLQLGVRRTFMDAMNGVCMGINVDYKKLGFSLRNDATLSLYKPISTNTWLVTDYKVAMYVDVSYHLFKNSYPFVGFGWISNSDQIQRFNPSYGYYAGTIGWRQEIGKNIKLELRGDIPTIKQSPIIDTGVAFPISMSLFYTIGK